MSSRLQLAVDVPFHRFILEHLSNEDRAEDDGIALVSAVSETCVMFICVVSGLAGDPRYAQEVADIVLEKVRERVNMEVKKTLAGIRADH